MRCSMLLSDEFNVLVAVDGIKVLLDGFLCLLIPSREASERQTHAVLQAGFKVCLASPKDYINVDLHLDRPSES
jgi:hypothetical protein